MGVVDLLGQEVHVGDIIAGAFRESDSGVLKVGEILGFGMRGDNVTIKVQWNHTSGYGKTGRASTIEAHYARFVLITEKNARN